MNISTENPAAEAKPVAETKPVVETKPVAETNPKPPTEPAGPMAPPESASSGGPPAMTAHADDQNLPDYVDSDEDVDSSFSRLLEEHKRKFLLGKPGRSSTPTPSEEGLPDPDVAMESPAKPETMTQSSGRPPIPPKPKDIVKEPKMKLLHGLTSKHKGLGSIQKSKASPRQLAQQTAAGS